MILDNDRYIGEQVNGFQGGWFSSMGAKMDTIKLAMAGTYVGLVVLSPQ